jgi:thiosulfate/3-mercaptopyruvate sulfurtransferase
MDSPLYSAEALRTSLRTVRVIDARASRAAYDAAHVEGAVYADLNVDLSGARAPGADPAHGGRHPLPAPAVFAETLGAWGITPDTPVVVYDDKAGANAAARTWWMLRSAGHAKAYVLDGGYAAAVAANVPMSSAVPSIPRAPAYPFTAWKLPTATIDQVAARAASPEWTVLDVRSPERYRGETEPLDPVAGRIPGAKNVFYESNLAADGRFRSPEEIRAIYTELLGGLPAGQLVVSCGSGVTACHTLLALEAAGLRGASLYVGSWSEWCRSGRPQGKG